MFKQYILSTHLKVQLYMVALKSYFTMKYKYCDDPLCESRQFKEKFLCRPTIHYLCLN